MECVSKQHKQCELNFDSSSKYCRDCNLEIMMDLKERMDEITRNISYMDLTTKERLKEFKKLIDVRADIIEINNIINDMKVKG